jgi:hypothetical protein
VKISVGWLAAFVIQHKTNSCTGFVGLAILSPAQPCIYAVGIGLGYKLKAPFFVLGE